MYIESSDRTLRALFISPLAQCYKPSLHFQSKGLHCHICRWSIGQISVLHPMNREVVNDVWRECQERKGKTAFLVLIFLTHSKYSLNLLNYNHVL